jgi:hypothetical protein
MEEEMKYNVYRVDQDPTSEPFDSLSGYKVGVDEGVYRFYLSDWFNPTALLPVDRFYVIKED